MSGEPAHELGFGRYNKIRSTLTIADQTATEDLLRPWRAAAYAICIFRNPHHLHLRLFFPTQMLAVNQTDVEGLA